MGRIGWGSFWGICGRDRRLLLRKARRDPGLLFFGGSFRDLASLLGPQVRGTWGTRRSGPFVLWYSKLVVSHPNRKKPRLGWGTHLGADHATAGDVAGLPFGDGGLVATVEAGGAGETG